MLEITDDSGKAQPSKADEASNTSIVSKQVYGSIVSILIGESSIMVDVGHMKTLDVSVVPSKYQDKLVWTSLDETVATVRDGIVTAVAPGITSVTAQSPYGYSVIIQNDSREKVMGHTAP